MIISITEQLMLRHFRMPDAEPMYRVFGDPEVMRFGEGVQRREWVDTWLKAYLERYYQTWGFGPYAVVEEKSQDVIGYCGLFYSCLCRYASMKNERGITTAFLYFK